MREWSNRLIVVPLYLFALAAPVAPGYANAFAGSIMVIALLRLATPAGRESLPPWPLVAAVLALIGTHALAAVLADPYPARWDKWSEELWLKLLLLAVPIVAGTAPHHARRAAQVLISAGAVVAVYAIYQHFTGSNPLIDHRLPSGGDYLLALGFFDHHLTYGGHVLVLLMFAIAWALQQTRVDGRWRPWPAGCAVLLTVALMWSVARSALVGAAAGAVALVLLGPPRWRRWGLVGCLAALLVVALVPTIRDNFARFLEQGDQETRLNLWQSSLDGIAARPWLGFGPGNFGYLMQDHGVPGFYDTKAHSHNDFLMHGVNAGLLGLLAALAVIAVTVWLFWRGRSRVTEGRWLLNGGIAAQVAISAAGLFQVYQTDDEVEMVLYFLLGCAAAVLPRRPTPATSAPGSPAP